MALAELHSRVRQYSWLCGVIVFLANIMATAIMFSPTIHMIDPEEHVGEDIAIVATLNSALIALLVVIIAAFIHHFGYRLVMFAGCAITIGSLILYVSAKNTLISHFCYGIIAGFVIGLFLSASVFCL